MIRLFARGRRAALGKGIEPPPLEWKYGFERRDFLRSIPTAFLCWFLTVIFSVSLAALIFRGALAPYLAMGIGMSLFTAAVVGLVVSVIGSLPGTIAIPSDRTAPMLAILVGSIAATFPRAAQSAEMIQTCLGALILSTFLTGLLLALLGHYRLGRLVRFLPFPVVGGFMAGAGWLLLQGAMVVLTGQDITLGHLEFLAHPETFLRWGPAFAMACALVVATRWLRHFLVIPLIVTGSVVVFYFIAGSYGISLDQLRAHGWLPGPFPHTVNWQPVTLHLIYSTDWGRVLLQSNALATVLLVSSTSVLLISSAMELAAQTEVDADRELEAAGVANLAAVLGGGLVGFHSLSLTSLALRIGPASRWVGLITAAASALTLLAGPNLVTYLPVPVLGGLLLYLGLNFLAEWLVDARKRMPRSDYLIIVLIVVIVAWAGYLVGVGFGLLLAILLFALRYSRIDIVRLMINGSQHRSNVDRSPEEQKLLVPLRDSILILQLQGFIFFGTAHSLLHRVRVRAHAADHAPLRFVFLDFRHVTGLDSSTLLSFTKLLQVARLLEFRIICTNLTPPLLRSLRRDPALFQNEGFQIQPDIDHAMESCEQLFLEPHRANLTPSLLEVESLLEARLPDRPGIAPRILRYFQPQAASSGSILARQGDTTRDLFLLQKGQISACFQAGRHESVRLRTMGPGSVVGEIGLYLNLPRTASLVVDAESLVWRLTPEALDAMEAEDPPAAAALHAFLARTVASRLVQANELLEISMR